MTKHGKKGLFLGLSWFSFVIVIAFAIIAVYLVTPRVEGFYKHLPLILWIAAGFILVTIGGGLALITIAAFTGADVLYPHGGEPITMRVLFPVVLIIGGLFGINKDLLRDAFVDTNNALVRAQRKRISAERVLILLPHCLQHHDCPWKITFDVENCKRCGKCDIAALAELSDKYGTAVRVATGGTLARRVIRDYKPSLILAVACGRDLSSGIIDAHPFPVYGVTNERPNGPCFDTTVNLASVEKALEELTKLRKEITEN